MMLGKHADFLNGTQEEQKTLLGKPWIVQKTIKDVFCREVDRFSTFKKLRPVFLFKDQTEHKLK